MNFNNIIRKFFGLPRESNDGERKTNDFRNPIWNVDDDENTDDELSQRRPNNHPRHGFHVFSDPIEIHRFFEKQMDEIMKSFGGMSGMLGGVYDHPTGEFNSAEPGNNLRDAYLKPGYQTAASTEGTCKTDGDVDGKMDSLQLNDLFKKDTSVEHNSPPPHNGFFSKTIITQTVTKCDGSVETRRTVKDSEGHETTTVTTSTANMNDTNSLRALPSQHYDNIFANLWKLF